MMSITWCCLVPRAIVVREIDFLMSGLKVVVCSSLLLYSIVLVVHIILYLPVMPVPSLMFDARYGISLLVKRIPSMMISGCCTIICGDEGEAAAIDGN